MESWDQDDFWDDGAQNTSTDVQQGEGAPQWGSKSSGDQEGDTSSDGGAPSTPSDPNKGDKPKSKDSRMFLVIGAAILVIAIVAAVIVGVMHKRKTSGSVTVGTSQVQQYQQGSQSLPQGSQGSQSLPQGSTSQGTEGQSSQQGSTPQGGAQSQQGSGSHSEKPNTSWDSTTPPNPNAELKEVSELPEVAKEGESAGIVYSKHVYEVGDSYLYALVVSISVGEQKDVDFFVSKDTFASVNTGSIVQVKFTQYSNGKVGINSISRN